MMVMGSSQYHGPGCGNRIIIPNNIRVCHVVIVADHTLPGQYQYSYVRGALLVCIGAATVILQYQNSRVLILQLGVIMNECITTKWGKMCHSTKSVRSHCESLLPLHISISLLSPNLLLVLLHMFKLLLWLLQYPHLIHPNSLQHTNEHIESSCIFTAFQLVTTLHSPYSVIVLRRGVTFICIHRPEGPSLSSLYDLVSCEAECGGLIGTNNVAGRNKPGVYRVHLPVLPTTTLYGVVKSHRHVHPNCQG